LAAETFAPLHTAHQPRSYQRLLLTCAAHNAAPGIIISVATQNHHGCANEIMAYTAPTSSTNAVIQAAGSPCKSACAISATAAREPSRR
jgi:hypothetical protein